MFRLILAAALVSILAESTAQAQQHVTTQGIANSKPAEGRSIETDRGWMVAYEQQIPGTEVSFEMVPVPGGVVQLPVGSEEGEPVFCEVELPPYWVASKEVSWDEYRKYMLLDKQFAELQQLATLRSQPEVLEVLKVAPNLSGILTTDRTGDADTMEVDAVTAPTPLYDPSTTYESGEAPELPAVTMSPFAARQYTKWLSALTGCAYRLPSEAEWLHAAAAGEPIDFAAEPNALPSIAWYDDNSDYVAHHVGQKEPNKWGLYDTFGNVAEQVLDAHRPDGRSKLAGRRVGWAEGVAWPKEGEARLAKGGWYDAPTDELTFGMRLLTEESDWKASDPNLPRSPWWYADYPATGVGFRIVRQLEPIAAEYRKQIWDTADPVVARAVAERLREGRGKLGLISEDLPTVLEELNSEPVRALLK